MNYYKKILSFFLIFFICIGFLIPQKEVKANAPLTDIEIPEEIIFEVMEIAKQEKVIIAPVIAEIACKGIIAAGTYVSTVEASNPGITVRVVNHILANLPSYFQMLVTGSQVGLAFLVKWMKGDITELVEDENVRYEIEYDASVFQAHHFEKYGLEWILEIPNDYTRNWKFPKKQLISGLTNNFEMSSRYYPYQHKHGFGLTVFSGMVFPDVDYSLFMRSYYYEYEYGWTGLRIQHTYSFPDTDIQIVVEGTKRLSPNQMDNGILTDILFKLVGVKNPGKDVIQVGGMNDFFTNAAQSSDSYWVAQTNKFINSVKKYLDIDLIMPVASGKNPYYPGRLFDLSMVGEGLYSHGYVKPLTRVPVYIPNELPDSISNPEIEIEKLPEVLNPVVPTLPKPGIVELPIETFPKPKPPNEIYPDIELPNAPQKFPGFTEYPKPMPDIELKPNNPNPDNGVLPEPEPEPEPDPEPGDSPAFGIPKPPPIKFNFDPLIQSGWDKVFPFCLPWDLVNIVKAFDSPSAYSGNAPVFLLEFPEEYFGSYASIEINFEKFIPFAKIVRFFTFLSFFVGIIVLTRKIMNS